MVFGRLKVKRKMDECGGGRFQEAFRFTIVRHTLGIFIYSSGELIAPKHHELISYQIRSGGIGHGWKVLSVLNAQENNPNRVSPIHIHTNYIHTRRIVPFVAMDCVKRPQKMLLIANIQSSVH